jgi:hypothetical protein
VLPVLSIASERKTLPMGRKAPPLPYPVAGPSKVSLSADALCRVSDTARKSVTQSREPLVQRDRSLVDSKRELVTLTLGVC